MRVKEKSEKVSLKLNIKKKIKTMIIASGPITSWQIEEEKMEAAADFIFLGSKLTANCACSHEIKKMLAPWKKSYDQHRQHIKKQRHYFANKGRLVKAEVFPVVVYACESWTIKKLSAEELMLLNCGVGEDS